MSIQHVCLQMLLHGKYFLANLTFLCMAVSIVGRPADLTPIIFSTKFADSGPWLSVLGLELLHRGLCPSYCLCNDLFFSWTTLLGTFLTLLNLTLLGIYLTLLNLTLLGLQLLWEYPFVRVVPWLWDLILTVAHDCRQDQRWRHQCQAFLRLLDQPSLPSVP